MLINPSAFYPQWADRRWKFKPILLENAARPYYPCICLCQAPPAVHLADISPVIDQVFRVDMKADFFRPAGKNRGQECKIFAAPCELCETIYWSSENFDWVAWLTDAQTLLTVISQASPAGEIKGRSQLSALKKLAIEHAEFHFDKDGAIIHPGERR